VFGHFQSGYEQIRKFRFLEVEDMAIIKVTNLVKEYSMIQKKKGFSGFFKNLLHPQVKRVKAVDGISFEIPEGQIVGYIGPNGAGKSTTIKMMTGILHPTEGTVEIKGMSPQKSRKKIAKTIGVVFGQRTQLNWTLPLRDSFELMKRLYNIDDVTYRNNLEKMKQILRIDEIMDIPVRKLSLGQRMKGDLAAAVLHSPDILFLDEPTIGLDLETKHSVRQFIKDINREMGVTVILTTHDLDDVHELCHRLIVINHGQVVEDGALADIIARFSLYRILTVELSEPNLKVWHPNAEVIKQDTYKASLRYYTSDISAAQLISDLSQHYPVKDLTLNAYDIEYVIKEIYNKEKNSQRAVVG
jgi:ABC-2 type transport system ATP-binding protein